MSPDNPHYWQRIICWLRDIPGADFLGRLPCLVFVAPFARSCHTPSL